MAEHSRLFRSARALLGATQQELAESSGVSKATLNNIERGVSHPRKRTLQMIEDALAEVFVIFHRDVTETAILYKRLVRPTVDGIVKFGNQRLMHLTLNGFWSNVTAARSLFRPTAFIFFVVDGDQPEPQRSIGALIVCQYHVILMDRLRFQLTTAESAAIFATVMQQAFHFHADSLFFLPNPPSSFDNIADLEACTWIEQAPKEKMAHVLPLVFQIGDWHQWLEPWLRIQSHPMRQLFLLLESEKSVDDKPMPTIEPIAQTKTPPQSEPSPEPEKTNPDDPDDPYAIW